MSRSIPRRVIAVTAAAALGLSVGAALTGVVQRHNATATSAWRATAVAQDALIEITTLEALRAELSSAGQFDRDRLLQLWREHEFRANDLLNKDGIKRLDPDSVANAQRWMSLYSAAADRQVSIMTFDPEQAAEASRNDVIPAFTRLQEAIRDLRAGLERLGPDAQRRVDRDLWIVLPALATIVMVIAAAMLGARRRAAIQAAESARDARFKAIVHGATDVLSVISADRRFVETSSSAITLFGRHPDDLLTVPVVDVLDPADRAAFNEAFDSVVQSGRTTTITVHARHGDGGRRVVELTGSRPNELEGTAWVWHDVSAQTELSEQLRRQAFQDDLTGLANRALLRDRTSMALSEPTSVSMLLVDVDRFQLFNDALGHAAGDEILRAIAGRIRSCVRPGDTVARLGGDEFAALLSAADPRSVDAVVERMLEACRQPLTIEGREIRPTVSIGIATAQRGSSVEDLLRRSDTALSIAKTGGRDRSQIHLESMDQSARHRVELATDLHHAVDRNQLVAVYQPIVSLHDGTVSGFESLLRWQHPDRGMISPVEFIPLAEENGTIIPIGRWILDQAIAQAALTPAPLRMNVNLSARQLSDPSLVSDVAAAIARHQIDPTRIVLEITESLLLDDADATMAVLHELRGLGCLMAIDDFGTGYSSLGYLRRLPVNIVKLDKSFLDARLSTSDGERAFLESVLHVGQTLGLETVAEGIEDAATCDILRSIGCDKGQGYLFSKPVSADQVAALVSASYFSAV
jgi:diguanylate cyclase (GGDEF)-like protein/PAS domain S-box-containing protein